MNGGEEVNILLKPIRASGYGGKGPRPRRTRTKLQCNAWILQEKQGLSQDEAVDPRGERKLVLSAVQRDLNLFRHASEELRKDKKWVAGVVAKTWRALEHVNAELKNDRAIVLSAVKQDGRAMKFASEALRNDKEIILAVLAAHPDDSYVCGESSRGIARLSRNRPAIVQWFGEHGACEAVAEAMLQHADEAPVQLQGCRALAALCTTLDPVSLQSTPHEDNQDRAGDAGACGAVVAALNSFQDNFSVMDAAVSAGSALAEEHNKNRFELCTRADIDFSAEMMAAFERGQDHVVNSAPKSEEDDSSVGTEPSKSSNGVANRGGGNAKDTRNAMFCAVAEILSRSFRHGAGISSTVSPTRFEMAAIKKRGLFPPVSSLREGDSPLDAVRGDGGGVIGMRKLLMKNIDAGLGIIESEDEQMEKAQKARPKIERPPMGKPSGFEHLSTTFCVTDA